MKVCALLNTSSIQVVSWTKMIKPELRITKPNQIAQYSNLNRRSLDLVWALSRRITRLIVLSLSGIDMSMIISFKKNLA